MQCGRVYVTPLVLLAGVVMISQGEEWSRSRLSEIC